MANPLKILTSLSASYGAAVSGSDGLKIQQGGLTIDSGDLKLSSAGLIKNSSGTTVITVDGSGNTTVNGALKLGDDRIRGSAGSDLIITTNNEVKINSGGLQVTGSTTTSGSLTIGGGGTLTAGAGTFSGAITANGGVLVNNAVLQVTNGEISGSSELKAGGAATLAGGVTITGAALNASAVAVSASALNVTNAASVGSLSADGNITVGGNIVADANENKSIFAAVTSNTITVGASGATVSIPGTASVGGNLTIGGNLTVNGTTTTVSSQNVTIKDKNVILGVPDGGAAATDSGADGGGITLSGSTDKSFQWSNATDSWTSSEHLDLASGKAFKIGTVEAVKQTSFSQGVDNDSITLAITGSQLVSGSSTAAFIGVGAGTAIGMGSIGDAALLKGDIAIVRGESLGVKIEASGSSGQGGVTIGAYGDGETITLTGSAGSVTLSQLVTAVGGGTGLSKASYYSARNAVVAHNNSGSTSDVIFNFYLNPAANEGQFSGENWEFHRITGLSGSTEAECLNALGYASIDVMTRDNGVTNWTNDLVSVKVEASSSSGTWYPKITVSAPALTRSVNTKIRLILINESQTSVG